MCSHGIKIILAYDGTRFFGWQKTKTGPSVQEELEKAIQHILNTPLSTEAASRTDRGVHAKGQIAHFRTDQTIEARQFQRALNAVLPREISVQDVEIVDDSFHPTLNAISKEYHYWICNSPIQLPMNRLYSWHIHHPLDLASMQRAALDFLGTHDFSAFSNEPEDHAIRTIEHIAIQPSESGRIRIEIRADRFLYKMVRNIVGTLAYIGLQKLSIDSIPQILASKMRKNGGITAPAHGLFLMEVFYTRPIK
jgi:tRNA pseudouridine38-40 synthase